MDEIFLSGLMLFGVLIIYTIFIVYFITKSVLNAVKKKAAEKNRINKRKNLLKSVEPFLSPYENIWQYQILSNHFVKAELRYQIIYIKDDTRTFKIKTRRRINIDPIWDRILQIFHRNTSYDDILLALKNSKDLEYTHTQTEEKTVKSEFKSKYKVDINNCSKIELTRLAGINIAVASRIVKRREEIKGFKTEEEFFEFINLKEHLLENIKKHIVIRRVKREKKIKLFKERKVDF